MQVNKHLRVTVRGAAEGYVLFEIVWVNSVGWPIYFFSTFDSFFSWAANLSILLATVGTFFAIYYAQLLKIY